MGKGQIIMNKEISIVINDMDSLVNRFNNQELSKEVGDYIFNESFEMRLRRDFVINVITRFKVSNEEKGFINDMIHRYFGLNVKTSIYYIKFSLVKQLILFVLGVLIIVCAVVISSKVISEVLLICGWVCVWETVYGLFFVDTKYHIRMKRYKELSQCKVNVRYEVD